MREEEVIKQERKGTLLIMAELSQKEDEKAKGKIKKRMIRQIKPKNRSYRKSQPKETLFAYHIQT